MAKKISLINMKGGVGKSTIATNLGHYLAGYVTWEKKVLIVDVDPQFNATQYVLGFVFMGVRYLTILKRFLQLPFFNLISGIVPKLSSAWYLVLWRLIII